VGYVFRPGDTSRSGMQLLWKHRDKTAIRTVGKLFTLFFKTKIDFGVEVHGERKYTVLMTFPEEYWAGFRAECDSKL